MAEDARDEQDPKGDADTSPFAAFGEYLRGQRHGAKLSLRQLAEMARVSNPYLSQIERGLHQPSINVVKSLADALNVSADALLRQAAGLAGETPPTPVELAIRNDRQLTAGQKETLLSVYRSLVGRDAAPPVKKAAVKKAVVKKAVAKKAVARKAAPVRPVR
jgi:transcriptional regulator with XRE-family HTH domain